MRKVLAFAALGLVLSITAAGAQRGGGGQGRGIGGGRGGGMPGLFMLMNPELQKELKMTEQQTAKVQPAVQEMFQKMQELRQQGGGGQPTPEEQAEIQKKMTELQTKAVADILDTKQQKRLHQIELQMPGALGQKALQEELKITADQKKQIAELQGKQGEEMRAARQGFDFRNASQEERDAMNKKTGEIQKSYGDKINAVLTEAQKKQLKEMQGEPFKMNMQGFGRPGGARPAAPPPAVRA